MTSLGAQQAKQPHIYIKTIDLGQYGQYLYLSRMSGVAQVPPLCWLLLLSPSCLLYEYTDRSSVLPSRMRAASVSDGLYLAQLIHTSWQPMQSSKYCPMMYRRRWTLTFSLLQYETLLILADSSLIESFCFCDVCRLPYSGTFVKATVWETVLSPESSCCDSYTSSNLDLMCWYSGPVSSLLFVFVGNNCSVNF